MTSVIDRRTFIGGCVAAGAGAALPGVSPAPLRLFDPNIFYFKEVLWAGVTPDDDHYLLGVKDGRIFSCSKEMYDHFFLWFRSGRNAYGGNMPTTGCKLVQPFFATTTFTNKNTGRIVG